MPTVLNITVIRANLTDRYFPEKHGVWARLDKMFERLSSELALEISTSETEIADGENARKVAKRACADGADFILLVHGGFTMGDVAREVAMFPVPMGVLAVPGPVRTGDVQLNNFVSLNMTMSIARRVRDLKKHPLAWYYGAPEDPALMSRLRTSLRALIARKSIQRSRIGLVGGLAPSFYNMEVSNSALKDRLGIDVLDIEMSQLTGRMDAMPSDRIASELDVMRAAGPVNGVSDAQMELSARCALGLRDIAMEGGFAALAVSDWPALQEYPGMHPGGAFSWLEETDQMPCASEGDVLGAVTQLLARALGGKLGCLLDMTEPAFDTGRLLMWHGGGGPMHMADDNGFRWINHPMIGRESPDSPEIGCIADFVFRPGAHSVFRLARDASALFRMQSEVVAQDPSGFTGCRGWMENFQISRREISLGDVVASVMGHGLEHHFVALPVNHADALAEFATWTGMEELAPRPARGHLSQADFT